MIEITIKTLGNRREVPPGVPDGDWFEEMRGLASHPDRDELLAEIPWIHPVMEYLEPTLLVRLKIQALVWRKHTGAFPAEIAWWWPVRQGRRRGQVPHGTWSAASIINSSGVLQCGFCGARWSPHHDGSPHADRCKLCDRITIVAHDEREDQNGPGIDRGEWIRVDGPMSELLGPFPDYQLSGEGR